MRAGAERVAFEDRLLGPQEGVVDDFVVRRNDGAPAYNLAVVVDDAAQGDRRGRPRRRPRSTRRRASSCSPALLGLPEPAYAHVPLVLGPDGARLAKRHGDVTLREVPAAAARALDAATRLGLPERPARPPDFDPGRVCPATHDPLGTSTTLRKGG